MSKISMQLDREKNSSNCFLSTCGRYELLKPLGLSPLHFPKPEFKCKLAQLSLDKAQKNTDQDEHTWNLLREAQL